MKNHFKYTIIGAGIIGLAIAERLSRKYNNILVIEKEKKFGLHTSSRNSEVLHSGFYYPENSLKAKLCVQGNDMMYSFCKKYNIPHQNCGKLIVASSPKDFTRLNNLYERGKSNKVEGLRLVEKQEIQEIEPHVRSDKGLYAPKTGIVDYREVSKKYSEIIINHGAQIQLNTKLIRASEKNSITILETSKGPIESRYVINCAGLHSDLVANYMGVKTGLRIIPFRGEYYTIQNKDKNLINSMIYPLSDPQLPFLGIHLTKTVEGGIEAGPNAVFAFAKEGYTWGTFNLFELISSVSYLGFWRLVGSYFRTGIGEMYRSLRKKKFLAEINKFVKDVYLEDLEPKNSGVRAQAVDRRGNLIDDFYFLEGPHSLHVINAPSPAATASLAIAEYISLKVNSEL